MSESIPLISRAEIAHRHSGTRSLEGSSSRVSLPVNFSICATISKIIGCLRSSVSVDPRYGNSPLRKSLRKFMQ